ncbi:MAG: ornithine--oxo-acid transaminase [Candidatus Riflebacteria bacterium]|nr:ornithine--oxo-acid transaminase [Candidatus Riflebacteria bacterium]
MSKTREIIEVTEKFGAKNYKPLPVVISKAEGIWVEDPEGKRYMDMLSAYSAVNQGHRHPRIIQALKTQAEKVTLVSRAFHNDQLGPLMKELCDLTGMEMVLPMNTGAEAVETALKTARKWGYKRKGVQEDKAEIIVCENNFHGRTTTIVGFSSEQQYKDGFGPFTPGFVMVPYGNVEAFEKAITKNTVGFLVEPIQGEAGVIVPPPNYLKRVSEICKKNKVLLLADEIQTGFGRTGKMFCYQHDDIIPDMVILGKALGGGVLPISVVVSSKEVLGVFNPGDHGSTFGGNPLACAVAREAVRVLIDEKLPGNATELGKYFMDQLKTIKNPLIKDVRGKGLLIGLELLPKAGGARKYCEALKEEGLLCKETHDNVIRFAPPLVIKKNDIDWALDRVRKIFS